MTHELRRPGAISGVMISLTLGATHAFNDVLMAGVSVLLPTLQRSLDASALSIAVLVAVFTVSSSAVQPLLGAWADRTGSRRLLAGGVAMAAVSLSLLGAAGSLPALVTLLVLGGLGAAAFHPVAMSIIRSSRPRGTVAVGGFSAAGLLGFAAGPMLILAYVDRWGIERMYWLMVPGLILASLLWLLLPDWRPHGKRDRSGWRAARYLSRPMGQLLVTSVMVNLVLLAFLSAVPLWLVTDRGLPVDSPLIGAVLGVFAVAAGAGALLGGTLGERFGFRPTAMLSLGASSVPLVLMLWLPFGIATLVTAAGAGALLNMSSPLLVVRAQEVSPLAPATATGLIVGVASAIAGLLYVGVGLAQAVVGYGTTLVGAVVLLVPALAATWWALMPAPGSEPAQARKPQVHAGA